MNKYKLYMIISIIILIISIGGSFAWYTWASAYNASVALGFCVPEVSFIGGETLQGDGLIPTTDKNKGLKKQIDVYLNKTCKEGDSGVMNLYMKLDILPDELKDETFIFEVVKDDVVLYSGNFKDKSQGQTIELLTNQIITENDSIYFIYVYIDGTRDNPSSMSGQSFRFTVWGEGTGAIYKNNVIAQPSAPSSSSSVFLNTEIARSSIQTLTIAEDNTVPEESQETAVDISSEGDGSVMLWYTYNADTEKYDIYMGSENGVIETNTNGQGMFAYLENVESLDLTNLDTSNITNMSSMFKGSKNLKEIKISNFNTNNVTSMQDMFNGCSSLTSIDVSNFDTSKVTTMFGMFSGCSSLISLDLSNFDTSNVTEMGNPGWSYGGMFQGCSSLTSLNLSNFDTANVKYMGNMFDGCSSLTSLDVSNWDTSNVTHMSQMFRECSSLMTLDVSNFDTSKVTKMNYMFYNCKKLISLDLSSWNTEKLSDIGMMFYGCESLTTLDVSSFDTSNVTSMSSVFCQCKSLTSLDLSGWNTSSVTSMASMFNGCNKLINLNLNGWNTENVTDMSWMFRYCYALVTLDLSSWNTSSVTNMFGLFYECSKLTTIYVSNLWNTSSVTQFRFIFANCNSLVGGAGTVFDSNYSDVTTYARIDGGVDSPGYLTLKTEEL